MVSKRIQEARKSTGLSQGEFAKRMSVHRVTLSDYERGVQVPSIETVGQVAALTGRPVSWFFLEDELGPGAGFTPEAALEILREAVADARQAEQLRTDLATEKRAREKAEAKVAELTQRLAALGQKRGELIELFAASEAEPEKVRELAERLLAQHLEGEHGADLGDSRADGGQGADGPGVDD